MFPICVVPKTDGGWRLITHLSHPVGNSVNDLIDPDMSILSYTSFDTVVKNIADLGPGALIGKFDIKSAFRFLPVYPEDFDLLGFKFEGLYYIDKCLRMGCAMLCHLFEKFSTIPHWLTVSHSPINTIDHYLDDCIFAGKKDTNTCANLT